MPRFFGRLGACFAAVVLAAALHPASAATYALSADGNAVVRLDASTAISSAGFDASLITSAYAGWTVTKAAAAPGGSIAVGSYDAGWRTATTGGGKITASYSQTNAVAAGNLLHWVQVINTNIPLGGATSPYIDPQPNDDNLPFYWTAAEQAGKSTTKTTTFSDFSTRSQASLATTNPITWNAKLYQVEYDGNKAVTVRDGISWGWNMKPATVGASAGAFVDPAPSCPPSTCSGIGSNTVSWGQGDPGSLSFASVAFAPKVGELFKIGTLTYHNGATTVGTAIDGVGLDIAMSFSNVAEANFTYKSRLGINNTPNTDDPIASADYVAFTAGGFANSFRVLEGATASADVMARLTPKLTLTPLGASNGDKDPDGEILPTGVFGFDVELVAFANPTDGGFIGGVPEAQTWVLMLFGLAGLVGAVRLRAGHGVDTAGA